jgi:dihydrofolate reductase
MALLRYGVITSLDGYANDQNGEFDWAAPSDEMHAFVNDLERPAGTYLYGRRMYEMMVYWETADRDPDQTPVERDYTQVWKSADKVVFSTTLDEVSSERTRIERDFDPEAVRRMKAEAERDLTIAGPTLAAHALRAGLVDELHQFVTPVVVGGGTPWLPSDLKLPLELLDERRFGNGVVYLRYRAGGPPGSPG